MATMSVGVFCSNLNIKAKFNCGSEYTPSKSRSRLKAFNKSGLLRNILIVMEKFYVVLQIILALHFRVPL